MGAVENSPQLRRQRDSAGALIAAVVSSRVAVYFAATAAALLGNYLLGKEMMADTLSYHLYAGFAALHDRFGQDYFPAGPQAYFNPYVYVPFYLLATSGLPALAATSLLAIVQSGILWLTYEIALEVAPGQPRVRNLIGLCAVALAFANPILIGQLGSSFADLPTAELVLAGWLLLLRAVRSPDAMRIVAAGLVLGVTSALKVTNSGHALCALVLLAFIPGNWRDRVRLGAAYGAALFVGFVVIAAPWALRLERHFGNPLFPMLNGVFHSRQYPTTGMLDYRFIPDSLSAALLRPFALLSPMSMVDNEFPSPDLRYALVSVLAIAIGVRWAWLRARSSRVADCPGAPASPVRALAALGCAFVADWILWLTACGNGRYFIAMACVAAVLAVAMLFRLLATRPGVRNLALLVLCGVQVAQMSMASVFRAHVRWDGGPWFEVSVPEELTRVSNLYFTFGDGANAFVAPYLSAGSGIINIGGTYELGTRGVNGAKVESLMRWYAPHLRVLMRDPRTGAAGDAGLPDFRYVDDALETYGLRADRGDCARIVVRDVIPGVRVPAAPVVTSEPTPAPDTGYLVSCRAAPDQGDRSALLSEESAADVVFDRIERACPELFTPAHQVTRNYSGRRADVWVRQYPGTGLDIFIGPGGVEVAHTVRGGPPDYLGRESDWLKAPVRLQCGRVDQKYHARVL